ncbi:ROK family transcriptional regulator [Virgibacillus soli]|uniref:ROK family transcriptional regulator n=1 Tax=Paracerasibacillus soli TaxID=480284 RepID=A0ABU5CV47_9BACI|nr:ROK family transcriptional regulator [Virgibacillus soli]MDY0409315.1 ROK family transcriptional regulator [Virgibacillus soli]
MQREGVANIKTINMRNVLNCIVEEHALTRADISKRLNLSKPTVSSIVKQLTDDRWILEVGSGSASAGGGRKPVQLKFNAKRSYLIGIDIGGTNVTLGLTDLNGDVCAYREFPTQQHLHSGLFEEIERCVDSMRSQLGLQDNDILGLGVGLPGITNVEEGFVVEAPALGWKHYPVREKLENIFDFPIYVDNDVNSVVLGEHWKGAANDKSNLIYIAIGTGIGSGIILNGELYRGSNYSAGEMGYLVTDRKNAKEIQPVFKGYGYLESVASGSSISQLLSTRLNRDVTAKEAFELYAQHDADAMSVIDLAIDNLAIGIANYVSLFDPEIIILGGGVSKSFHLISEKVIDIIRQHTPQHCDVVQTTLGKEAGVIGAAALFLKEHDLLLNI